MKPYNSSQSRPLALLFLLALPAAIISATAPLISPSCSQYIGPSHFVPVIFQENKGMIVTCNKASRSYVKIPFPKDNILGSNNFARYRCIAGNNFLVNANMMNERLYCVVGCPYPAGDYGLKVTSDKPKCQLLNEKGSSDPDAYINCELRCMDGYYSDSQGKNHVSNLIVYCAEYFNNAYWEIPRGVDKEPYVRCTAGCFMYGSYQEDAYGMISNFKAVGSIEGVRRYVSGELYCDEYEGFFAVSRELKPNLMVTCVSGEFWEPVNPEFYCRKGCRRPGGGFGKEKIRGYYFSCSDGTAGWYLKCSYSCDAEEGYTMVARSMGLPEAGMAEQVACDEGEFDLVNTKYKCEVQCFMPVPRCPANYLCTGVVLNHKLEDTGKRYCVYHSTGSSSFLSRFTAVSESMVTAYLMGTVGSYEWLK